MKTPDPLLKQLLEQWKQSLWNRYRSGGRGVIPSLAEYVAAAELAGRTRFLLQSGLLIAEVENAASACAPTEPIEQRLYSLFAD